MLIEAIVKVVVELIGLLVSPILDAIYNAVGYPEGAFFPIPAPLFGYATYYVRNVIMVMPLLIIFWTWRQVKS